mmetsp:Transcript_21375/g.46900  ORF Transcript_21375/g.46900 Transcript_21375/m.46900 type:complete len:210 (-) Transcript_21375:4049-4678(-)
MLMGGGESTSARASLRALSLRLMARGASFCAAGGSSPARMALTERTKDGEKFCTVTDSSLGSKPPCARLLLLLRMLVRRSELEAPAKKLEPLLLPFLERESFTGGKGRRSSSPVDAWYTSSSTVPFSWNLPSRFTLIPRSCTTYGLRASWTHRPTSTCPPCAAVISRMHLMASRPTYSAAPVATLGFTSVAWPAAMPTRTRSPRKMTQP